MLFALLWLVHPNLAAAAATHTQHAPIKKSVHHTSHKKAVHSAHHKKLTNKKTLRKKRVAQKKPAIPNDRTNIANATPVVSASPSRFSFNFFSSVEHRLVDFVHKTVNNLKYSVYKLGGTHFDAQKGVYIVDCSDYVDHLLETVHPDAYFNLVDTMGAEKPTTQHYYDFFRDLSDSPSHYWNKVDDVEHLQAGDILVFRYKNSLGHERGGHVMVVMDKPTRDEDDFLVKVADSARVGHTEDTRGRHVSGIGIGTLVLKANPTTGKPLAYAWSVGARWNSNVKIAMARPIATHS